MELGATVCTPRRPDCAGCPLSASCVAHASGDPERLPRPKPRPAPLDVELELLVVERRGRVLLERRPDAGRMAGMWQLPTRELVPPGREPALFPAAFDPVLVPGAELGLLRHTITRHRIRAVLRGADLAPGKRVAAPLAWHPRAGLAGLPLTAMAAKALRDR
jgi:A/G-specific adenine glycosylase